MRDLDPLGGDTYSGPDWEITTARAEHAQPYLESLDYRVDSDEGSVVFTGDTRPCQPIVELAKDADLMICMCWDDQDMMAEAEEDGGMCGTTGAAGMAQQAGVKKLVLNHIGPPSRRSARTRGQTIVWPSHCEGFTGARITPPRPDLPRRTSFPVRSVRHGAPSRSRGSPGCAPRWRRSGGRVISPSHSD